MGTRLSSEHMSAILHTSTVKIVGMQKHQIEILNNL